MVCWGLLCVHVCVDVLCVGVYMCTVSTRWWCVVLCRSVGVAVGEEGGGYCVCMYMCVLVLHSGVPVMLFQWVLYVYMYVDVRMYCV